MADEKTLDEKLSESVKDLDEGKGVERKRRPRKPYAVYSGNERDDVFVHKVIYKNQAARNSLSVLHVQRALQEKGYDRAALDKPGYYGYETMCAFAQFAMDEGIIEGDDSPDRGASIVGDSEDGSTVLAMFEALFKDDPNVRLHP